MVRTIADDLESDGMYMASLAELLAILFTSFGLNLVPFASPSNLIIASNAALMSPVDPVSIGLLVALGSAFAKSIHYMITYFAGEHLGEKRRKRLDAVAPRLRRWGFFALFVAAATPIPDEPVIIPLGLLKYNPAKFFIAFFSGKLLITILGAYFGKITEEMLSPLINQEMLILISVVLTIAITILLLKLDIEGIAGKILGKATKRKVRLITHVIQSFR